MAIDIEIKREEVKSIRLSFSDKKLINCERRIAKVITVRLSDEKKSVIVSGSLPEQELILRARNLLKYGEERDFELSPAQTISEKMQFKEPDIKRICEKIREIMPENLSSELFFEIGDVSVNHENTKGFSGEYSKRYYSISFSIPVEHEGEIIFLNYSDISTADNSREIIKELLKEYESFPKKREKEPANLPVVLHPDAVSDLIKMCTYFARGEYIHKCVSPFCDKLGEKIFSGELTIEHIPDDKNFAGWRPFDDECTPTKRFKFIEKGVLRNLFLSRKSAKKLSLEPNGCAIFGESPFFRIEETALALDVYPGKNLLTSLKDFILIRDASFDIYPTGEFVADCILAYLYRKGKKEKYLRSFQIAGNIFDILGKNLIFLSKKRIRIGNIIAPYIGFSGVKII